MNNTNIYESNSEANIKHKRSNSHSEKSNPNSKLNFGLLANYNPGSGIILTENSEIA